MKDDAYFMARAITLAYKGAGRVNPNPMVGAVLVKDGRIISEGYHRAFGEFHAERNCLLNCTQDTDGAVLYVTLEPCCHYGKTPPCTEIIIEKGIKKVVVGAMDPNPLVAGKGVEILRNHGITVVTGVLEKECREQNRIFFHYITTGKPFVTLKYAMTMDGRIATWSGKSKWITGEAARRQVHMDRNLFSAIMTGRGTIEADDPLLTCRIPEGRNPLRILCDTKLRIPFDAQVIKTAGTVPTVIATCQKDASCYSPYEARGVQVIYVPFDGQGHVDLNILMEKLGKMKIDSILLEGGSSLAWSALKAGIVSRVQAYIAPKIFGGRCAPGPVGGKGVECPEEGFMLKPVKIQSLGGDFLIESEVCPCLQESLKKLDGSGG